MQQLAEQLANSLFKADDIDELSVRACEIGLESQNLPFLPQGIPVQSTTVAQILSELKLDKLTLMATLMSGGNLENVYSLEQIKMEFGDTVANLVEGIRKLNRFKDFHSALESNDVQNERLRQMLLAMTSDVRVMVVKLAYRVARLRLLKHERAEVRTQIAVETQLIFAPLANRLGIFQLKWELEDLSFRFMQPDDYLSIAKQLSYKRGEREAYIESVLSTFKEVMDSSNIAYKITGRPKHIYSIWKKMTRKSLSLDELYDLRAVRIHVDTVQQCYEVLGLIHSRWSYVKKEFDDYIASPKGNGYQSIHTVIYGPEGQTVEIQIRTHAMHHVSEFGVAAHWRYKEGESHVDERLEKSIDLVRQMLECNDDADLLNNISTELLSEQLYVMTPRKDVITLSQGSTALDFAYHIHTNLGHQCRGVKINGMIQPITTLVNTGDVVEVLAVSKGTPSRNWLNPNLGYLHSPRSRAKVRNWFNLQNKEANIELGEKLFTRESKRVNVVKVAIEPILKRFRVDSAPALYEALGKGVINEYQLATSLQKQIKPTLPAKVAPQYVTSNLSDDDANACVVGSPQLQTRISPCCKPVAGDDVVGYVTRGNGITVHATSCNNILNLTHDERQRLIEVEWCNSVAETQLIGQLHIEAFDRKGLLGNVMMALLNFDVNLTASNTKTNENDHMVDMLLDVEIPASITLATLLDGLEAIQNVESAMLITK